MNDHAQKILLKKIVHKYIPESIMDRPKMGFGIPLQDWFKADLKPIFMDALDPQKIREAGILDEKIIKSMKEGFLNNKFEQFERLWLILVFQLWYQRWMN